MNSLKRPRAVNALHVVALSLLLSNVAGVPASVRAQAAPEIPPDATPEIQKVQPDRAAPGDEVTVAVEGKNFSPGAYVSCSNPYIRVVSTRRVSPTELEAKLAVGSKASPGAISLFVSNPASKVAETAFTISPPPNTPAAPAEVKPAAAAPEISGVEPAKASPGNRLSITVKGRNFDPGAKLAFSNPGIQLVEKNPAKSTELTATIQIAQDAAPGETSLFVVNPDETEAEARFDVAPAAAPKKTAEAAKAQPAEQSFDVYNLGEGISIIQNPHPTKGTLALAGGKITYQENGQEIFSAALGDIKEIAANTYFGVNTQTFHIILNAGKTYNFIAASFRPSDTQAMLEALQGAKK